MYLDLHLCSMTILKEHSREICHSYGVRAIRIGVLCFVFLTSENTIAIGEAIIRQGSLCHFCHFCRLAIIRRSERVPFVISVKHNAGLDDRQIWTCAITLCFASFWYPKCFVLVAITLFSVNLFCYVVLSCCVCVLRFCVVSPILNTFLLLFQHRLWSNTNV